MEAVRCGRGAAQDGEQQEQQEGQRQQAAEAGGVEVEVEAVLVARQDAGVAGGQGQQELQVMLPEEFAALSKPAG
jgi:hypothetical protein